MTTVLFPHHANVRSLLSKQGIGCLNAISSSFSTGDSGPVFTADIRGTNLELDDVHGGTTVASTPLTNIYERTLQHTLTVEYGPTGSINYAITDASSGAKLLSYAKSGRYTGTGGT